jgi:hypothetical protein
VHFRFCRSSSKGIVDGSIYEFLGNFFLNGLFCFPYILLPVPEIDESNVANPSRSLPVEFLSSLFQSFQPLRLSGSFLILRFFKEIIFKIAISEQEI